MERIQQALMRAREVRDGKTTHDDTNVFSATRPDAELSINYSHTRQIEASSLGLRDRRLLIGNDESAEAAAYKILRTQVLQRLKADAWNTIAVVSPNAGEGKTLTAANLAISLACEVSHSVLLVDLDLRRPALHRLFGDEAPLGLSDYLHGGVPLSDLLFNPGIERLIVLPGGKPVMNSAELLSSPKMAQLVDELKTRYPSRIVLFDTPALLSNADTLAFSPYVDAALLVIEDGKTSREDVTRAVELLRQTNVLGTVLNKSHDASRTQRVVN